MSNELDKRFADRLGRYESVVDGEALWAAVRPPRPRRPWLWPLLLIALLSAAGAAWWATTTASTETPVTIHHDELNTVMPKEKRTTQVEMNDPTNESRVNAADQAAPPAGATVTGPVKRPESARPFKVPTETICSVSRNARERTLNLETTPVRVGEEQAEMPFVVADPTIRVETEEPSSFTDEAVDPVVTDDLVIAATERPRRTGSDFTAPLAKLSFAPDYQHDIDFARAIARNENLAPPSPRRETSTWFAQLDATYGRPLRTLAAGDSILPGWVADRVRRERVLDGIGADLSVGKKWRSGWQARVGLGYTQINTVFEDNFTIQTVDTVEGLQMLIYQPDNSVDSIFGPVAFYETTTRKKKTYNSIRQWEIPLLVGYEYELGKLSVMLETGVRLQLNRSWEGETRYGDEALVNLADQNWYRSDLAVTWQSGLALTYPLSDRLTLLGGGTLRYSLSDFTVDDAPFRERYDLSGGQIGLRYAW